MMQAGPELTGLAEIEQSLRSLFHPSLANGFHQQVTRKAGVELDRSAFFALAILKRGESLRISELAEASGVDASTMSRLVDRLVDYGLVEANVATHDRRVVLLQVSERGKTVLKAVETERRTLLARALAGWSESDQETFATLLSQFVLSINRVIQEEPRD
jgi:DNA-binding MarR family transcriptional regulator